MSETGPVQVLALAFGPEARYEGQILDELERLEGNGQIRVLDLLFVAVDTDADELVALNYQGDDLGGLLGALLGFTFADLGAEPVVVQPPAGHAASVGLSRPQLEQIVRDAPPDAAIGMLLIEHVWARDFTRAMREAGAQPLAEGFLSAEALAEITVELEQITRILDELEAEDQATIAAD